MEIKWDHEEDCFPRRLLSFLHLVVSKQAWPWRAALDLNKGHAAYREGWAHARPGERGLSHAMRVFHLGHVWREEKE